MAMNKADNLDLMARPADTGPEQLTLPLPVKSEVVLTDLQKKQRANFEAVCLEARNDSAIYLAVVKARFPEANYSRLRDVTIAHLRECHAEYADHPFRNKGKCLVPHPEIEIDYIQAGIDAFANRENVKPKKKRKYTPWTQERKWAEAQRKLKERALKQHSIPDFWIPKAIAKIMENPWRYGVCPLPSEGSCIIPDPGLILSKRDAMARELHLRAVERGEVEALKIPLNLKQPDYAEVTNDCREDPNLHPS